MAATHPTTTPRASFLFRAAWIIVLAMMLTAAAWSISHRMIAWGMPPLLAYGVSLMFDVAALLCATYARRAVARGVGALLPRTAILAFVGLSGLVTYHHGHAVGGAPAGIAFASTSAMVELLFELDRRDRRDAERAARGLVGEMLPRIPASAWLMYPGRSWATLRAAVGVRLDTLDPLRTDTPARSAPTREQADATVRAAVRAAAATMPDATDEQLVGQLAILGIPTDAATVRELIPTHPTRHEDAPRTREDDTEDHVRTPIPTREDTASSPPTIADTVREFVAAGADFDDTVHEVRRIHGPVGRKTIWNTHNRIIKAARA